MQYGRFPLVWLPPTFQGYRSTPSLTANLHVNSYIRFRERPPSTHLTTRTPEDVTRMKVSGIGPIRVMATITATVPTRGRTDNITSCGRLVYFPSPLSQRSSASKVFSLLGYLTATSAEDPVLLRYVCKRASATEANAKEATKALRKEFKYVLADFFSTSFVQSDFNFRNGDALRQLSAVRVRLQVSPPRLVST